MPIGKRTWTTTSASLPGPAADLDGPGQRYGLHTRSASCSGWRIRLSAYDITQRVGSWIASVIDAESRASGEEAGYAVTCRRLADT